MYTEIMVVGWFVYRMHLVLVPSDDSKLTRLPPNQRLWFWFGSFKTMILLGLVDGLTGFGLKCLVLLNEQTVLD